MSLNECQKNDDVKLLKYILKTIYGLPASVTTITGVWKSGKTNWALSLKQYTQQCKIIHSFAGNIETDDKEIQYIDDFVSFDLWKFSNSHPKLFFYDEVGETANKRNVMSSINKGWFKRLPQLSKSRTHLIVIAHKEDLIDKIFLNDVFNRGMWHKENLYTVSFRSKQIQNNHRFNFVVPPTTINYAPYVSSVFNLTKSDSDFNLMSKPMQVFLLYAQGKTFEEIRNLLGFSDRSGVRHALQSAMRATQKVFFENPQATNNVEKIISKSVN